MLSYSSGFATDIEKMMEWRDVLGYKKESYEYPLKDFDTYCREHFPDADVVTWEIALAFLETIRKRRDNRCDAVAIRNLARYQIMSGKDACVFPADYFSHHRRRLPHIMSSEECRRFFEAADCWPSDPANPLLEYTVAVIFRLQYATGMRPREVRMLTRMDFDFVNDTVYIADSKSHKDRCLAIDHDIMDMCARYDAISRAMYPDTAWFFPNRNQNPHSAAGLQNLFHKCWKRAGNPDGIEYCTPYILRHNYATHMLMKWIEEGRDIDNHIPYLSAFMGHETFRDTYYYIHLLPERLSHMACMDISDVIGEVAYEE